MSFWAVQDVTETVALLAEDARSIVHMDDKRISMSGEVVGRDAIAEGLYGNLATWHYISFDWAIANVDADTAHVRIVFDYQHQKTGLRLSGTMRMVVTVHDGEIVRVECRHDGPLAAAFLKIVAEREAEMMRGD
jgi:ketosteroid isomerase-like protein